MPWYWPFKRKHTPARNGGTVAATVTTPIEDVANHVRVDQTDLRERPFQAAPANVDDYVKRTWPDSTIDDINAPNPVRLAPVDYRYRIGDRVLTVNGSHVWEVVAVNGQYTEVVVAMTDSRGRRQRKTYHPGRLLSAGSGW